MFFLLNDIVLNVSPRELTPPMTARRFAALDFDAVRELGQELFSEYPRLQETHPERAARLATLLLAKGGRLNAAQFIVPGPRCDPEAVAVRFADIDFMVMADLYERQQAGRLTGQDTDRKVWRRQAA